MASEGHYSIAGTGYVAVPVMAINSDRTGLRAAMRAVVEIAPAIPAEARLADRVFFHDHKDRRYRIREPIGEEFVREFRGFCYHEVARRRVIVARVSAGQSRRHNVDFIRVPFLLFADETVEDRDDVVGPILDEVMRRAAADYGLGVPPRRV